MAVPECFCWTRFGTEAGEEAARILEHKEEERLANRGVFLWGIGNAIGPSVKRLITVNPRPEVLFSPMKSRPKPKDVHPLAIIAWTSGQTLEGDPFSLPQYSRVTSRHDPGTKPRAHYALVCSSNGPVAISDCEDRIELGALQNLLTGKPVGASQVTAVVRRREITGLPVGTYGVAMRADLVPPYFIRLRNPQIA